MAGLLRGGGASPLRSGPDEVRGHRLCERSARPRSMPEARESRRGNCPHGRVRGNNNTCIRYLTTKRWGQPATIGQGFLTPTSRSIGEPTELIVIADNFRKSSLLQHVEPRGVSGAQHVEGIIYKCTDAHGNQKPNLATKQYMAGVKGIDNSNIFCRK